MAVGAVRILKKPAEPDALFEGVQEAIGAPD
jgi:hypothetical protein